MTSNANGDDDLYFLPLGGSDEIGMNVNLYGYAGKWLMVDLGITFGDDSTPGLDVILPDISFIEKRRKDLVGLVITHGHEDHIGAIPYLWEKLRCPIWCTPFTASLVRRKLDDVGLLKDVTVNEVPISSTFVVGPFEIEMVRMTHSIPEPSLLVLRTGAGTVVHTGDWKFDPNPVVGEASDMEALARIGKEKPLAMIGDSTNVFVPGSTGSELDVKAAMTKLFAQYNGKGRIAVACFASNVARLDSIARAAAANDRSCALVGRSLWRMTDAARENGYLSDLPPFVAENEAGFFPEDKIVMICTGSQGEARAALSRIADGSHPHVGLGEGDICIYSSRQIPGNELAIARVQNRLANKGVEIVTTEDHPGIHVSGHPAREDMIQMYQLIRPSIAIPVHGDAMHLREHARLAQSCQVPEVIAPANGSMIRLRAGAAAVVEEVQTGALVNDGGRLVSLQSQTLSVRRQMLYNGSASVTLVMDKKGVLKADPIVSFTGVTDGDDLEDLVLDAADAVRDLLDDMSARDRTKDDVVREATRRMIRKLIRSDYDKRPLTDVHLVRLQ
jgi:ribonuclease J